MIFVYLHESQSAIESDIPGNQYVRYEHTLKFDQARIPIPARTNAADAIVTRFMGRRYVFLLSFPILDLSSRVSGLP